MPTTRLPIVRLLWWASPLPSALVTGARAATTATIATYATTVTTAAAAPASRKPGAAAAVAAAPVAPAPPPPAGALAMSDAAAVAAALLAAARAAVAGPARPLQPFQELQESREQQQHGRQQQQQQEKEEPRMAVATKVSEADRMQRESPPSTTPPPRAESPTVTPSVEVAAAGDDASCEPAVGAGCGSDGGAEWAAAGAGQRPTLQAAAVPASRVGRLFEYGGLAVGVGMGVVGEAMRRATGFGSVGDGTAAAPSLVFSERNVERIVRRLSRMRGAALKLGQMLSIQDNAAVPPELRQILERVQNSANYMPPAQLEAVMASELGPGWRSRFAEFDDVPFAAASIGQVHRAVIARESESGGDTTPCAVAVKVQYPGVAGSIGADLSYVGALAAAAAVLPRGMYLDRSLAAAREELGREVDYEHEAAAMQRFARELAAAPAAFQARRPALALPGVVGDLSTLRVLTSELVPGVPVGSLGDAPQDVRDR
ncbi:hypothetical protein HK405_009012, partial [Cladochytrium tenue]